jgi:hypothetical protein
MQSTLGQPTPLMDPDDPPYSESYFLDPGFWYCVATQSVSECTADFNDDGLVDGLDFIAFRNEWGSTGCGSSLICLCDMNDDGNVDGLDFIIFRNNWGNVCK